jgi:hypothetical protein
MMHRHADPISLRMILVMLIALLAFLPLALPTTQDRQPVHGFGTPHATVGRR